MIVADFRINYFVDKLTSCRIDMSACRLSYCKDNINFSKPRLFISIFYEIVAYFCKKPYICKQ